MRGVILTLIWEFKIAIFFPEYFYFVDLRSQHKTSASFPSHETWDNTWRLPARIIWGGEMCSGEKEDI